MSAASPTSMSENITPTSSTSPAATPGRESSTSSNSTTNSTSTQRPQQQQEQLKGALTPCRSPPLPMFEFDPRNVLNQLSPAQFQQLLTSLATQNLLDPTTTDSAPPASVSGSTVNPNATNLNTQSNLTPYHHQQPSFDFSQQPPASNFGFPYIAPETLIPFSSFDPSSTSPSTTTCGDANNQGDMNLTLLNPQEQREHEERMAKEWETTENLEDNVNGLHSRIHSLAQALGLDPVLLDNDLSGHAAGVGNDNENHNDLQMGLSPPPPQQQQPPAAAATTTTTAPGTGTLPSTSPITPTTSGTTPTADFDFDSFFSNIAASSTDIDTDLDSAMDYTSTAFLDEVPTPASSSDQTASPVMPFKQDVTPEVSSLGMSGGGGGGNGPAKGTRKRKSDAGMDLDIPGAVATTTKTTTGGHKSKRRKDK